MYVCVYIYIHTYVCIYIYIYIYVYTHHEIYHTRRVVLRRAVLRHAPNLPTNIIPAKIA